jgi:hypothetical protein
MVPLRSNAAARRAALPLLEGDGTVALDVSAEIMMPPLGCPIVGQGALWSKNCACRELPTNQVALAGRVGFPVTENRTLTLDVGREGQ